VGWTWTKANEASNPHRKIDVVIKGMIIATPVANQLGSFYFITRAMPKLISGGWGWLGQKPLRKGAL